MSVGFGFFLLSWSAIFSSPILAGFYLFFAFQFRRTTQLVQFGCRSSMPD
jgi:hypothetical protein